MDNEKIEKQAKQILDKFAQALESVEKDAKDMNIGIDREDFERIESKGDEFELNEDFKKAMLKNAPEKDDDFILVEKGDWK